MRIAIIATGSRGDVQPYIALGKGLNKAGQEARLVTHQNFEELVNAHGIEFWPIALIETQYAVGLLAMTVRDGDQGKIAIETA
jgi:UDP:flavonoid glycosyltransferase YjiC (YdhE family)